MFAHITNFDEPHDYYTSVDDGSLWHKVGPIVTDILRSKSNPELRLKSYSLNRALLLCEPIHVLHSIGYDPSNPSGDGGIDERLLQCGLNEDSYKSKVSDFSKYFPVDSDLDPYGEPQDVPLLVRVLNEYHGLLTGHSTSTIGPDTVLETNDMFENRLRSEYEQHVKRCSPPRRIGFSVRRNIAHEFEEQKERIFRDAREQRNSEVHTALLETKFNLIKDICDYIVGNTAAPEGIVVPTATCDLGTQTDLQLISIELNSEPALEPDELDFNAWDVDIEAVSNGSCLSEYSAVVILQSFGRMIGVRRHNSIAIAAIRLYLSLLRVGLPAEILSIAPPDDITATTDLIANAEGGFDFSEAYCSPPSSESGFARNAADFTRDAEDVPCLTSGSGTSEGASDDWPHGVHCALVSSTAGAAPADTDAFDRAHTTDYTANSDHDAIRAAPPNVSDQGDPGFTDSTGRQLPDFLNHIEGNFFQVRPESPPPPSESEHHDSFDMTPTRTLKHHESFDMTSARTLNEKPTMDQSDDQDNSLDTNRSASPFDPFSDFDGHRHHRVEGNFVDTEAGRFEQFQGYSIWPHVHPDADRSAKASVPESPALTYGDFSADLGDAGDADDGNDGPAG